MSSGVPEGESQQHTGKRRATKATSVNIQSWVSEMAQHREVTTGSCPPHVEVTHTQIFKLGKLYDSHT